MNYKFRKFSYICKCGYTLVVNIDFGTTQEKLKCRKCGSVLSRID